MIYHYFYETSTGFVDLNYLSFNPNNKDPRNKTTENIRNITHNLDLKDRQSESYQSYQNARLNFIALEENEKLKML